jgi:acetylornithine/succinyldiaminopimelate/putrescine aminotransferase
MGFGRTGKWFSFENYGFIPDILILAKAMGGGMPIGAFVASKEVMDTLTFNPELGHITTFGGHPVSCAAALAGIGVLAGSDLIGSAGSKGKYIEERLSGHPHVKEIRRKGMILGVELADPGVRNSFTKQCLDNGVIIDWFLFNPSTFRIAPPLTISNLELSLACDRITESFDRI